MLSVPPLNAIQPFESIPSAFVELTLRVPLFIVKTDTLSSFTLMPSSGAETVITPPSISMCISESSPSHVVDVILSVPVPAEPPPITIVRREWNAPSSLYIFCCAEMLLPISEASYFGRSVSSSSFGESSSILYVFAPVKVFVVPSAISTIAPTW